MRRCTVLMLVCAAAAPALDVTWDTVIRLTTEPHSQTTGTAGQRSIAADTAGNLWVAWLDQRSVPGQLWYRKYDAAARAWQPEQQLTSRPVSCFAPSVAADTAGNIHVAWHIENWEYRGIWYKRRAAGTGVWTLDTLLVPLASNRNGRLPALACSRDRAELAWLGHLAVDTAEQVLLCEYLPDSGWTAPLHVTANLTQHDEPAVAADLAGNLCVAWAEPEPGTGYGRIWLRRRASGIWQTPELVSDMSGAPSQFSPSVAVTPDGGSVGVAWHGRLAGEFYQRVFHRRRTPAGWLPVEAVSGMVDQQREQADVACAGRGRASAVWRGTTSSPPGSYQLFYGERDSAGSWTAPQQLTALVSGSVSNPALCLRDRDIHVIWYDDHSGNQDVYYLHGTLPTGCAEAPARAAAPACPAFAGRVPPGAKLYGVDGRVVLSVPRPGVYLAVFGGTVCRRVLVIR